MLAWLSKYVCYVPDIQGLPSGGRVGKHKIAIYERCGKNNF